MGSIFAPLRIEESLANQPLVQRTRKILLILLGVYLAFSMVSYGVSIFDPPSMEHVGVSRGFAVGQLLVSIIFNGLWICAAYRYHKTGLRVFAWLSIILLVLVLMLCIIIIHLLAGKVIQADLLTNNEDAGKATTTIMTVLLFVVLIVDLGLLVLEIIIIKFSFKLARLIDANTHPTAQQA